MINVHFVIVGAVLGLTGAAFYIRDTLRGITHPNRVSWLLWGQPRCWPSPSRCARGWGFGP